MADNSMSMESQRTRWNVKSAYSSVGRAGDCSCSADISRSLVRFRVGGIFTLLVRVPGGCMFHALSREEHAPHAAKSRCESPAWVLPLFWDFSFTPLFDSPAWVVPLFWHFSFTPLFDMARCLLGGGGGGSSIATDWNQAEFPGSDQSHRE